MHILSPSFACFGNPFWYTIPLQLNFSNAFPLDGI